VVNGQTLQVRAILPDRPSNSTMQFGALVGVGSVLWNEQQRQQVLSNWMGINGRIYVKTSAAPQTLQGALQNAVDAAPWASLATPEMKAALGQRKMVDVALGPLADAYFDRSVANTMGAGPRGDMRMVLALGAAGLLILLLAVVNYINLATVRAVRRQREIAVRRVMGATTRQLLVQFMAEAMLLERRRWACAGVAAAAAGVRSAATALEGMLTPAAVAGCLAFGALVGAAAGLYPGWLARGVDMRATLAQRSGETTGGAWLRRVLTAVQFSAAIGMGSVALAMLWQTQFAAAASPASILAAAGDRPAHRPGPAPRRRHTRRAGAVARRRRRHRQRQRAGPRRPPGTRGSRPSSAWTAAAWPCRSVRRRGFFKVYGVPALAGRTFDAREKPGGEQSVVINPAAVPALGFASAQQAVGQRINGTQLRVIGVVPDLRWDTLRDPVRPLMYQLSRDSGLFTLRLDGTRADVEPAIAAAWQRYFPAHPAVLRSAASYYALAYADDVRWRTCWPAPRWWCWCWPHSASMCWPRTACSGGARNRAAQAARRGPQRDCRIDRTGVPAAGRGSSLVALPPAWLAIARYLAPFAEHSPLGAWAPPARWHWRCWWWPPPPRATPGGHAHGAGSSAARIKKAAGKAAFEDAVTGSTPA
jgi:putative ABC transport system permease protein